MHTNKRILFIIIFSVFLSIGTSNAQNVNDPDINISDSIKLYMLSTEFQKLRLFALDLNTFRDDSNVLINRAEKINLKIDAMIESIPDSDEIDDPQLTDQVVDETQLNNEVSDETQSDNGTSNQEEQRSQEDLDTEESTNESEDLEEPAERIITKQVLQNDMDLLKQRLANIKEINNNFKIDFSTTRVNSRSDIIEEIDRLKKITRVIKENLIVIYNSQLQILSNLEQLDSE